MNNKELKIAEEVAIADVKKFVEHYNDDEIDEIEVKDKYPKMVRAVRAGLLVFGEDGVTPVYTLDEPIVDKDDIAVVNTITFNTRIKPAQQKELTRGLDMKNSSVDYGMRCLAYLINQPVVMVNKFDRFDYKLLQELSQLFL